MKKYKKLKDYQIKDQKILAKIIKTEIERK